MALLFLLCLVREVINQQVAELRIIGFTGWAKKPERFKSLWWHRNAFHIWNYSFQLLYG